MLMQNQEKYFRSEEKGFFWTKKLFINEHLLIKDEEFCIKSRFHIRNLSFWPELYPSIELISRSRCTVCDNRIDHSNNENSSVVLHTSSEFTIRWIRAFSTIRKLRTKLNMLEYPSIHQSTLPYNRYEEFAVKMKITMSRNTFQYSSFHQWSSFRNAGVFLLISEDIMSNPTDWQKCSNHHLKVWERKYFTKSPTCWMILAWNNVQQSTLHHPLSLLTINVHAETGLRIIWSMYRFDYQNIQQLKSLFVDIYNRKSHWVFYQRWMSRISVLFKCHKYLRNKLYPLHMRMENHIGSEYYFL